MRLIKSNNIEPEYPKRCICDECGAELEYDKEDIHVGWMGCEYVTCPACNKEITVSGKRVHPPTWNVTFHHISTETGAVDIEDDKVQEYINEVAKHLCSDEWKPREFALTDTSNFLVFGVKRENGVDIYVTQDYWKENIVPKDYEMVK